MASKTVQELLEEGQRSGLLAAADAQDLIAQMTAKEGLTTEEVAARLIEKKVVTRYQAEQLLAGRGDECTVAGRYRILEKLGEGGMGAVYKGHDTQLDRDVAVKVLPAHSLNDADAIARFQREARALGKLSHPNIIQAYDYGEDKGRHFLVMEYVEGVNLSAILRELGAIPPTLAADMTYQAALGLQHAHEKGLVHRDVKPANLLLSHAGPLEGLLLRSSTSPASTKSVGTDSPQPSSQLTRSYAPSAFGKGIVKILDLGLARFLIDQLGDSQVTKEGIGVGTPDYMAPEQFRDALHADARTDIYGLGCTLYQLISGTVPFPGSSFSEKVNAHAKKEPIPLEERCPEVPAGLALVVSKMMAKHPADRFQSAAELAEALSPYVAGASHSMIQLRQTMRFHAGQLTTKAPTVRKRVLAWSGAAMAAACCIGLLLAWPRLFPPGATGPTNSEQPSKAASPDPPKVVTIENGLTVAKDGTGQHSSIQAALEAIQAGQTIQILDGAKYDEILPITDSKRHAGVTIEGLPKTGPPVINGFLIRDVPHVALRGLRLEADKGGIGAQVTGRSPGAILERLQIDTGSSQIACVKIEALGLQADDSPVVINECWMRGSSAGVSLLGVKRGTLGPAPTRQVIIKNTLIDGCKWGIWAEGLVQNVQVVGNQFTNAGTCGIAFMYPLPGTQRLLVANNTFAQCDRAFVLQASENDPCKGDQVQITNNLYLNCTSDVEFWVSKRDRYYNDGPGDAQSLLTSWQIGFNGRETTKAALNEKGRVPLCPGDHVQERIVVLSRVPNDANFLRPAKDSPLATGGAGGDLPAYIGALPPEGVAPWNWQWTWDAYVNKRLTVSKDPKDGGRFRTIGEALQIVKPGQTVRVVDDAVYQENLLLGNPTRHRDVTLEAPRHATIEVASGRGISIIDVPGVTVRGFRFRASSANTTMCLAQGVCPGLVVENLEMDRASGGTDYHGINFLNLEIPKNSPPAVVRKCVIRRPMFGIGVHGVTEPDYMNAIPSSRIIIQDNSVINPNGYGILLRGSLRQIYVVGNRLWGPPRFSSLQFDHLMDSEEILAANNTFLECPPAFRLWDRTVTGKNVEFRNNLFLAIADADMVFMRMAANLLDTEGPGDVGLIHKAWRVSHNWREGRAMGTGATAKARIPLGEKDVLRDEIPVLSRNPNDANFLRPAKDSPLATGGAGGDLPAYVGALPPEGVEPWDWNKTWNARTQNSKTQKSTTGKD